MWLIIICVSSFAVGLVSYRSSANRRMWINLCAPLVITLVVVVISVLVTSSGYERLWQVISIVPGTACGIAAAFLSEVPIAIFSRIARRIRRDRDVCVIAR